MTQNRRNRSKVIGLTGSIATGKSTVSKLLARLGAVIIDADKVAREIVQTGEQALEEIVEYYGEDILLEDGSLDRKKLGKIVFNDPEKLEKLNEITHPKIIQRILDRVHRISNKYDGAVIVIDAALLIEMNFQRYVDEVWVVTLSKEMQINRLMKRDQIKAKEAQNRIEAQMSSEEKSKYADEIIDNSGNLEELEKDIMKLWRRIKIN